MKALTFNGKFLSARPTGVHRAAEELLRALDELLFDRASRGLRGVAATLLVPPNASRTLPLKYIRTRRVGIVSGQPWEQGVLPFAARGTLLVNLCNLGPVARRDCVTMIHDAQVHSSPASYSASFRLWYRLVQPRIGARHRRILTVSEHSRAELARYGVARPESIDVIHNGCNHIARIAPERGARAGLGLPAGGYALAMASVQAHKNVAVLMRAFADPAVAAVPLVLYGAASRETFERAGLVVPPNVRFVGRIDDAALAALTSEALVLLFPSLTEGFGLPPLEAMRLGCPAIVAPRGAMPEVCGDAALYVDPHDAAAWASEVRALLDEPARREGLALAGRRHAARFDWSTAARKLLRSLESAGAGSPLLRSLEPGMTPDSVAVIVASHKRPGELALLLRHLAGQSLTPTRVLVSAPLPSDVPEGLASHGLEIEVMLVPGGLCCQRNAALDRVIGEVEYIVFFDDDYVPSRFALESVVDAFSRHPDVVGIEGRVLVDGVTRGGIPADEADAIVAADDADRVVTGKLTPALDGLYGCNMAFRAAAIAAVRFDETLTGYSWQEDIDFACRVGRRGDIARATDFTGVHRGVVGGRTPGRKLGYSQVANPLYFVRKGTMRRRHAWRLVIGNIVANHVRSLRPEHWIDRRGRAAGNWLAMRDLLAGRLRPANIERL